MPSQLLVCALLSLLPQAVARVGPQEPPAQEAPAEAAQEAEAPLGMCPVMPWERAEPDYFVDWEGTRLYFCCKSCIKDFRKEPEEYLVELETLGQPLLPPPAPVEPEPVVELPAQPGAGAQATATQPAQAPPVVASKVRGVRRLVRWLGQLHPAVVHFPIALAFAALLAELLAGARRPGLSDAARYCSWIAALGALAAAPLGWADAEFTKTAPDLAGTLFQHRWGGTATAVLLLAAAVTGQRARAGGRGARRLYRTLLVAGALAAGLVGHLGATLSFGPDYLSW